MSVKRDPEMLRQQAEDRRDREAMLKRERTGQSGRFAHGAERAKAKLAEMEATAKGTPGFGQPGKATLPPVERPATRSTLSAKRAGVTGGAVADSITTYVPPTLLQHYTKLVRLATGPLDPSEIGDLRLEIRSTAKALLMRGEPEKAAILNRLHENLRKRQYVK